MNEDTDAQALDVRDHRPADPARPAAAGPVAGLVPADVLRDAVADIYYRLESALGHLTDPDRMADDIYGTFAVAERVAERMGIIGPDITEARDLIAQPAPVGIVCLCGDEFSTCQDMAFHLSMVHDAFVTDNDAGRARYLAAALARQPAPDPCGAPFSGPCICPLPDTLDDVAARWHRPMAAPDTLDAAWARVEAALPDGFVLRVHMNVRGPRWMAEAWHRHDPDDGEMSMAPTVIAALHALADALEARRG